MRLKFTVNLGANSTSRTVMVLEVSLEAMWAERDPLVSGTGSKLSLSRMCGTVKFCKVEQERQIWITLPQVKKADGSHSKKGEKTETAGDKEAWVGVIMISVRGDFNAGAVQIWAASHVRYADSEFKSQS
jgi:hypothetical protein